MALFRLAARARFTAGRTSSGNLPWDSGASRLVSIAAIGVSSSCEALAMNCFCAEMARSIRSSAPLSVSVSCPISSVRDGAGIRSLGSSGSSASASAVMAVIRRVVRVATTQAMSSASALNTAKIRIELVTVVAVTESRSVVTSSRTSVGPAPPPCPGTAVGATHSVLVAPSSEVQTSASSAAEGSVSAGSVPTTPCVAPLPMPRVWTCSSRARVVMRTCTVRTVPVATMNRPAIVSASVVRSDQTTRCGRAGRTGAGGVTGSGTRCGARTR